PRPARRTRARPGPYNGPSPGDPPVPPLSLTRSFPPPLLSWESSNGPLTLVTTLRRVVLREEDQGRFPGEPPVRFGVRRGRPAAAVPRILARPPYRPPFAAGRGQERLRGGVQVEVPAEV